jgi:hypothetical protein
VIAVVLGFLAAVLVGLVGPHEGDAAPARGTRFASTFAVALAALIITAAFGIQLAVVNYAAHAQIPFPAWFATLPLVAIDDRGPLYGHAHVGGAVGACTLIETAAGIWLYRSARGRRFRRGAVVAVGFFFAVMLAAALVTPALTSFDLYAYAGSARVPDPYHPPRVPFAGDFLAVNRIYGVPIFPSPYGPAWLGFTKVVLAPFHSLAAVLAALRWVGALALLAIVGAVRALRFSPAEVAVTALNPGLIAGFVLDAHNDALAIALVLWAIVLARRLPLLAVAFGVLAGGIKLPFLAIGTLAFARAASLRARLVGAATIAATAVALSALLGGREYAAAVHTTSLIYGAALADRGVDTLHALLALAAVAAIALAVVGRRYWPSASWAFVALAASFFGWYVAWGLPYAALERRWFAAFVLSLPALTFLLSTVYAATLLQSWSLTAAIVAGPLAVYVALRRTARRRPAGLRG